MNSLFLPYEIALALKELGFDEPCFGKFYFNQLEIGGNWCNNDFKEDSDVFISAPIYQQALKWFIEKYNLFGHILSIGERNYEWGIQNINSLQGRRHFTLADIGGGQLNNTPEEAEFECLNKLIEIVKTKNNG